MTISQAHVSTHRGDVIYLEAVRWPVNCFTRSRIFTILVCEHRKTDNAHILDINILINWQLSKQGTRWPVSLDRIVGSGVDPSRSSIFLSHPLTSKLVFKWSQTQVYSYQTHYMECMLQRLRKSIVFHPHNINMGHGPKRMSCPQRRFVEEFCQLREKRWRKWNQNAKQTGICMMLRLLKWIRRQNSWKCISWIQSRIRWVAWLR